jgi:hypothetical protein
MFPIFSIFFSHNVENEQDKIRSYDMLILKKVLFIYIKKFIIYY